MSKQKTCTKSPYPTEQRARTHLNRSRKRRFLRGQHPDTWEKNVYLCAKCGSWHLTGIREKDYLTRNRKK